MFQDLHDSIKSTPPPLTTGFGFEVDTFLGLSFDTVFFTLFAGTFVSFLTVVALAFPAAVFLGAVVFLVAAGFLVGEEGALSPFLEADLVTIFSLVNL